MTSGMLCSPTIYTDVAFYLSTLVHFVGEQSIPFVIDTVVGHLLTPEHELAASRVDSAPKACKARIISLSYAA